MRKRIQIPLPNQTAKERVEGTKMVISGDPIRSTALKFVFLLAAIFMGACTPSTLPLTQEDLPTTDGNAIQGTSTPTPDPCTGWTCDVNGVLYNQSTRPGNELAGIELTLIHSSNCSPTRGEHSSQTTTNGAFSFGQIFFHDTDRIRIQIDADGSAQTVWDSSGNYCFFCSCFEDPLEIMLSPIPEGQ